MGNPSNRPSVVVQALHKSFSSQHVLDGVDLSVERGEILGVLGKSGTGKSVLLRLMIGLEKPDSGSIQINGQEITTLPVEALNEVRKKLGFLFQQAALYDSLTIEGNVDFPLMRHTRMSASERKDRAHELLASVGLDGDARKMPSEISGGMRKRAGIARALALDPEIVLFDEPTAGLDPITSAEIGKLISRLSRERGMTSIVVTHDVHGARHFANRLVMLNEGRILFDGDYDGLQKSKDNFVARYLSDAD